VSILLQDVLGKSASYVHRAIADEVILVPIRRDVADLESIYALEGVAPRIWELLDGQRTVGEIVASIVGEYDVDGATAEADVLEILTQLESLGAVEKAQ
jgi:hypothetical protein